MTKSAAQSDTLTFDDVRVTRVIEWSGPIRTVSEILPDVTAEEWTAHEKVMAPDFWDPATDAYLCNIQTWVIRHAGRTILVDTGVGNDRDRPQVPPFAHLNTDFLDRLAKVGVDPHAVDLVINTHIHYDHVGWNTQLVDQAFEPTFPNATYLVPRADYDHFHPGNSGQMRAPETDVERRRFEGIQLVFQDSIAPIEQSGQLVLWDTQHSVPGLPITLLPAPGHTPGSSVVQLEAGRGAVFVGDLLHSPMQLIQPDHRCSFDLDAAQARASRRAVLERAATNGAMIFPAHLPGHSAAAIERQSPGTEFAISRWADLPRS